MSTVKPQVQNNQQKFTKLIYIQLKKCRKLLLTAFHD